MARRSRSKQRGKGVGSRSQSAGKSKGGSRSSAGSAGGSRSGGNRSGSGARGNRGKTTSTTKRSTPTSTRTTQQRTNQRGVGTNKGLGSKLSSAVKNAFTGPNLSSGNLRNPLNASNYLAAAGAGYTDAVVGGVNFAKNLIPGLKQLPNVPTLPKYADKNLQNVRNISAVGIPLAQGVGATKRFMSVDPVSGKAGFANEIAKMTVSDAAFKAGKVPQLTKTGITNINPGTIAKAFTPQMVATGPTAGASVALSGAMLGGQATTKAGGLNIGSVDSGETSDTDNASNKASRIINAYNRFMPTLKNLPVVGDAARQTDMAISALRPYTSEMLGQDDKTLRKQASELLKDIGKKDELAPVSRAIKAFTTDDPSISNKPYSMFGVKAPFNISPENLADVRATFDRTAPGIPSISSEQGIVGAIGNRMLAGDLKNIVKEASADVGVEKGERFTNQQLLATGLQSLSNISNPDKQGYKSANKIKNLVASATGQPTTRTILEGVTPFRRSGSGTSPTIGGGTTGSGTVQQLPTIPQEELIPQIPQAGTDAQDLSNIQQQSYQQTFNSLLGFTPDFTTSFAPRRRTETRGGFRRAFSRDYFN